MIAIQAAETTLCHKTGVLIRKSGCYALHDADGRDWWLEMESIPLHLLDQAVTIQGTEYPPNLIQVERFGPPPADFA